MAWHITVPSWSAKVPTEDFAVITEKNYSVRPDISLDLAQKVKLPVNQDLLQLPSPSQSHLTIKKKMPTQNFDQRIDPPGKKPKKAAENGYPAPQSSPPGPSLVTAEVHLAKQQHRRERQREKRRRKRSTLEHQKKEEIEAREKRKAFKKHEEKPTPKENEKHAKKEKERKKEKKELVKPQKKKARTTETGEQRVVDAPHQTKKDNASSKTSLVPVVSKLQSQQEKKLKGARFRWLNERLYTIRGEEALEMMQESPDLFEAYHEGFASQVRSWPVNPVDIIIKELKSLPKHYIVADFGCGDAKIASSIPQLVHSFDLHSTNDRVVACDIAHVPLEDASVDVAVYCLALMGTNLDDFITEAHRVVKVGGQLKVAEVRSRFDEEHGGLDKFEKSLHSLGFDVKRRDVASLMFVRFDFVKSSRPLLRPGLALKPCVYKRR